MWVHVKTVLNLLFLLAVLTCVGCGGAQHPTEVPRGTIRFKGEPKDALLNVDELHLGPLHMFEKYGVKLKEGPHRIAVRKDGFFTDYRIIDVKPNTLIYLEYKLREKP